MIINAGGPVELTDLLAGTENICAILNISQLGQEGGRAVARILLGEAVPSGKLTTTWAKKYADVPFAENFSYLNGNLELEEYKEGIYVGYRYFDSFGVKPLFLLASVFLIQILRFSFAVLKLTRIRLQ